MRRWSAALAPMAALGAALALPAGVSAAPKSTLLVMSLEAPGISDALVTYLDREMREEIATIIGTKMKIMPKPALDYEGMRLAAGCVDEGADCLGIIARTLGATHVFRAIISGDVNSAKTKFLLLDVGPGKARPSGGELTDLDRDSAVELRLQVARAFGVKREPPPGSIGLFVASPVGKLDGAELKLDEQVVEPPALKSIPAGQHRLEVQQRGFEPFLWVGQVRPGKETRVGVELKPLRNGAVAAVPVPADPTRGIGAEPSDAAPAVTTEPAIEPSGPNYLLPGILGGAAVGAGLVALVQGLRVSSIESDLSAFCDANPASCSPTSDAVCRARPEDCDAGESAATMSTALWITAGVLAAGSIVTYFLAGDGEPAAYDTELAPSEGGASVFLRF